MDNAIIAYYFYIFIVPILSIMAILVCACCMIDRVGFIKINLLHRNTSYSLASFLVRNTLAFQNDHHDIKIIATNKKMECFICFCKYVYPDCTILDCDHRIHTYCLLSWWCKSPVRIGECPMCRQRSSICLIELTKISSPKAKILNPTFIGFYRNDIDHTLLLRKPYNLPTTVIPVHSSLKNQAQTLCEQIYNEPS